MSPTIRAACGRVSFDAGSEKYVFAAAWSPYAPWPK